MRDFIMLLRNNVPASIEFVGFMMNVKEDIPLNYAKLSQTALTVYQ